MIIGSALGSALGNALARCAAPTIAIPLVWLAVSGLAGAAVDRDAIGRAMGEMLTAARAMVDSGDHRDLAGVGTAGERVLGAGNLALAALPQPGNRHARDAADHVRQAMDHAKLAIEAVQRGQQDEASAHARKCLSHVRQGAGHAEAL